MKHLKEIPVFATDAEEKAFWLTHDSTEYLDWSKSVKVRLPNLKPSTTAISVRLPIDMLDRLKIAAHKRDVPYQSLLKIWIDKKLSA
ncbi:MAG: BrnA antitoxin family protein [Methylotenera sp.]|nr:BrnA antitoxin family protein [Methylotenera sp.]MDP2102420.1 BrnA antitoxin family protein [Methylotenera sp.]MDP2281655.1 BrnA antitoxin family protein [Methylotenera sp.]MDP2404238.1 BrnA antitoxin family protein [Methylotenera sp.]MDP3060850.1 BrnA antitoxin family protein [Methylotenera sp.]